MKITNKQNIPEALYSAMQKKWYSGNRDLGYSITEIMNPTRIVLLSRKYWDKIEEDATDRIYSLLGSSMHNVIERANFSDIEAKIVERTKDYIGKLRFNKYQAPVSVDDIAREILGDIDVDDFNSSIKLDKYITELRLYHTTKSGANISGQIDLYDVENKSIEDWKLTSIFNWVYRNRPGSRVEEFEKQLNMYRYLMESNGYQVDKLRINMVFRDWQKSKSKYDPEYPRPVEVIEIPIHGLDVVEAMIEAKITEIENYKHKPDSVLPPCTPNEKWQGQDTWAVKKKKNVKASKVFFGFKQAQQYLEELAEEAAEKVYSKYEAKHKQAEIDSSEADKVYNDAIAKAKEEYEIERRPSEPRRCQYYCSVNQYCDFWQNYKA